MRKQRRAGDPKPITVECSQEDCDYSRRVGGAQSKRWAEQSLVRTHNWKRNVRGNIICEFCREA